MNIKKLVINLFHNYGYEISKFGQIDPLRSLIYKKHHDGFFFVQIGANDGKRFDPIYEIVTKLKLNGIALEPVKEYFNLLKNNYKFLPNVKLINKAINKSNGKVSIYRVKTNNLLPDWVNGIASFNSEHYKKSGVDKEDIIEEIVDCITFDKLIDDNNICHIDLLQIDTEGFDFEIIKMIDFAKIKPSIIHFEHGLPDNVMSLDQFKQCACMLIDNGYSIIMKKYDCIAYIPD
ncbi:MAG: hypothetical protein CTY18_01855 [Methylomonas sp.]|nr:MAG: hypothetical protein CTY18_01855 [Methylomonas sp.]